MKSGAPQALIGLALLATAFGGLALDLAWVAEPFYAWAWWGWILVLDGFCAWRRASSLLSTRRRLVLPLAISSVTFWFLFEALNLRLRNWYYVGGLELAGWDDVALTAVFVFTAFATVFVGMFETIDALGAAGVWRGWRRAPRRFPAWTSWAVQGLGLALASVAFAFPHWLAPLVWGSLSLIVDPWNYRNGRRSLLADLERGELGQVARVLVGGLACGVVWESLNSVAPQKWIYTVRGMEGLKLFEMPLPGFLGFPALALDCFTAFAFVSSVCLGNATWEHPDDGGEVLPARPERRRLFFLTLPLQVTAWVGIAAFVMTYNVGSIAYEVDRLATLPASALEPLERLDLVRPRRLLRALDGRRRDEVRAATGLDEATLRAVEDEIRLYELKGIGPWFGELLGEVGVRRVEDLARCSAEELHARLVERAAQLERWPPRLDWVRVWVAASRAHGRAPNGSS